MTEQQFTGKLLALPRHLNTAVKRFIKQNEKNIIKRNQAQLLSGQDSNGDEFGGYKSASHVKKRKKKGLQTSHIDLKFEGDFQKQMYVSFDGTGVKMGSKDKKEEILIHHWGEDIFGLNDENFDWLSTKLFEYLTNDLKTYFT